jgi:hypothetical protein
MKLSQGFMNRSILFVLLAGNVVLGLTTFLQARTIQDQKTLIQSLFRDSVELTMYKVARFASSAIKRYFATTASKNNRQR